MILLCLMGQSFAGHPSSLRYEGADTSLSNKRPATRSYHRKMRVEIAPLRSAGHKESNEALEKNSKENGRATRGTPLHFVTKGRTLRLVIRGLPREALIHEVNKSEVWWRCRELNPGPTCSADACTVMNLLILASRGRGTEMGSE